MLSCLLLPSLSFHFALYVLNFTVRDYSVPIYDFSLLVKLRNHTAIAITNNSRFLTFESPAVEDHAIAIIGSCSRLRRLEHDELSQFMKSVFIECSGSYFLLEHLDSWDSLPLGQHLQIFLLKHQVLDQVSLLSAEVLVILLLHTHTVTVACRSQCRVLLTPDKISDHVLYVVKIAIEHFLAEETNARLLHADLRNLF